MPLIAPNICRFAVHQTMAGFDIVNVIDMRISELEIGIDRAEACAHQAGDIINAWNTRILPLQVNNLTLDYVSWVDLDSIEGSTGQRTSTSAVTLPKAGSITFPPLPGMMGPIITKVAPGGGRRFRNGRLTFAGVSEEATADATPNTVNPASVTGYTTAWDQFSADVSNSGVVDEYESNMVVVHTVADPLPGKPYNRAFVSASDVTAMRCEQLLGHVAARGGR